MGISYLIAGLTFFFLPNISIIDLLPDFIGCILIIKGLGKLSDLTPLLMNAKLAFIKAMYVNIAKFVLMFSVPYFGNTNDMFLLIFSFVFLVLDLIYVFPAFKKLLDGFVYLGNRTNASVLYKNQSELSTLTTIFLFVKSSLPVLADLSYISKPEYSNNISSGNEFYLSNYRLLLVSVNILVTSIVGVVWLVYAVNYFKSIKKDKALIEYLKNEYKTKVLTNTGLFIRRNIKSAFIFILVGGFLMFDLLVDSVNILPDFLGGLFILLAALTLKKHCKTRTLFVTSLFFTIVAIVSWGTLSYFAAKFPAVYIWNNFEAYELFIVVNITNAIKYIFCIGVFIAIYGLIKSIILNYAGASVEELKTVSKLVDEQQKVFSKQNIICLAIGILCCLSGILRMVLLYDFPTFMFIDYALNIIWYIYISKFLFSINDAVEYKYL